MTLASFIYKHNKNTRQCMLRANKVAKMKVQYEVQGGRDQGKMEHSKL